MIGIVVVSHSRALAEAAAALARQMAPAGACPSIGIAAGIEDAEAAGGLAYGTDADAVAEAIRAVDSPEGVLVLMDLGSAVMSAQFALEFVEPEVAERVRLCPAPLVEGLVTAVAAAACGASLTRVAEQAEGSLAGKLELLGGREENALPPARENWSVPTGPFGGPAGREAGGALESWAGAEGSAFWEGLDENARQEQPSRAAESAVHVREVLVSGPTGLHLRPASVLAALAGAYDAEVLVSSLEADHEPVPGDSLTDLLTLGAEQGHHLRLQARGPEAEAVLDAIAQGAVDWFGDLDAPETPTGRT